MSKKGRPPKKHEQINATFDEVLGSIARSKYEDKKNIEKKREKKK
jgi:hypothetical protein